MIENGYYKIQQYFFDYFSKEYQCAFIDTKNQNRPILCCIKDSKIDNLFWAVPTGSTENKNLERINKYLNYDRKSLGHSFYHLGKTNKDAIFYISDTFPIIDKYIDSEYISQGNHLILKNVSLKKEITFKLKNILAYENMHNNYFRQRISDIKSHLIYELTNPF